MGTHAVRLRFGAFGCFGRLIVEGAVFLAWKGRSGLRGGMVASTRARVEESRLMKQEVPLN